jgi:hypothetical protein
MKRFREFIENNFIVIILIFFIFILFRTCSTGSTNDKLVKQNSKLILELDSIKHNYVNKEELQLYLKIQGYEDSENMLNDYNDFARSKASPTERSRYYQNKREEAIHALSNLKNKK